MRFVTGEYLERITVFAGRAQGVHGNPDIPENEGVSSEASLAPRKEASAFAEEVFSGQSKGW